MWTWSRPPRFSSYGDDDAYYILDPSDIDRDVIDGALGDSLGRFGMAICSSCSHLPGNEIPHEATLDEFIRNTTHVLLPAFDDDGYMIWSPAK
jgi:hypothetical protein